jgi:hypothetical protein
MVSSVIIVIIIIVIIVDVYVNFSELSHSSSDCLGIWNGVNKRARLVVLFVQSELQFAMMSVNAVCLFTEYCVSLH